MKYDINMEIDVHTFSSANCIQKVKKHLDLD